VFFLCMVDFRRAVFKDMDNSVRHDKTGLFTPLNTDITIFWDVITCMLLIGISVSIF